MARILVIEKDARMQAFLQCRVGPGTKVKLAASMECAWEKIGTHKYDLIVWGASADIAAQVNFSETLKMLSARIGEGRAIVLTDCHKVEPRLCAGRVQVRQRPADDEELCSLVEQNLPVESWADGRIHPKDGVLMPMEFQGIIAVGLPMQNVIRRIMDAAAVDIPVLITGETGTGKDLVAAAIHKQSRRKHREYVSVNMGAIAPELIASEIFGHERGAYTGAQDSRPGIFEQANAGTVFLDEIATMNEKTQVSLLRVLEENTFRRVGGTRNIAVDVRTIAATNENLEKHVAEKRFREDLFYRLNVFHISVPPLRERPGAVSVLTDHFVSQFALVYGKAVDKIAPEIYRLLRKYPWPGNVRELKNVIQAAVLMIKGSELTLESIPRRIRDAVEGKNDARELATCVFRVGATLNSIEKEFIRATLAHVGGNKKLAASILGISRRALYNKIKNI
jgi:DNA-binding NtrC family response regulator